MYKAVLTLFLTCALLATAHSQAKSDRERANLLGNVKTLREKGPRDTGDTVTYDRDGKEIERIMVSDFGEAMGKETRVYDTVGLLRETLFDDAKGVRRERSTYSHSDGKLLEIALYDRAGKLVHRTRRSFDAAGRLIEESYSDSLAVRAKTVFSYGSSAYATEMSFFLASGKKATAPVGPCLGGHRVTQTYDANGRVLTKAVFDVEGRVKKNWEYLYDDKGNWSQVVIKSGPLTTTINYSYAFDAVGNWIKLTSVSDTDDALLDSSLKIVSGKTPTAEELKAFKDSLPKITSVTTREITYY